MFDREVAKGCMDNKDELIGLCNTAVTTKMKEVKEAGLHLPYRRFHKASLLLTSGKFLAKAQLRAPFDTHWKDLWTVGTWRSSITNQSVHRSYGSSHNGHSGSQLRWQQPRNSAAGGGTLGHP